MCKRKTKMAVVSAMLIGSILLTACGSQAAVDQTSETETTVAMQTDNTERTVVSENPNLATRISDEEDHYIFELSENVTRTKVYYTNRFGIEIAGDLYMAKDADMSKTHPALVVGPPFGGVKEQGPGVYANELAQRGYVVLAFDPSYHGYSGGAVRMNGSSDVYAEDFSAGVDYLGTLDYVDRERIGAIGICGSGGFALSAAAMDSRIKAVATSVMYDIAGLYGSATGEEREQQIEALSQQRWADIEAGTPAVNISYPEEPVEEVPEDLDPVTAEFYSFYGTERGHHPNALGNITSVSALGLMNFPSLTHIGEINRPILFIAGENAHSLSFSETAYENASAQKELYIVDGANHVDLYDQVDKIPFDKLQEFFDENL